MERRVEDGRLVARPSDDTPSDALDGRLAGTDPGERQPEAFGRGPVGRELFRGLDLARSGRTAPHGPKRD